MIQEINKTLNKKHVDLILNIFESKLKIFIKDNEIYEISLLSSDVS